jgi:hypothetical protein
MFFAFINSCYGLIGGAVIWVIDWGVTAATMMRNSVVQQGVLICRTAAQ